MARPEFNRDNLRAALSILQPQTPFAGDYQAHWYNGGFGKRILNAQQQCISAIKSSLDSPKLHKSTVGVVLRQIYPKWPAPPKNEKGFYSRGHGRLIVQAWDDMVGRFVDVVNNMVQPVNPT